MKQLLFAGEKILRGLREPHRREYFLCLPALVV